MRRSYCVLGGFQSAIQSQKFSGRRICAVFDLLAEEFALPQGGGAERCFDRAENIAIP
jgi:hypothetical protein